MPDQFSTMLHQSDNDALAVLSDMHNITWHEAIFSEYMCLTINRTAKKFEARRKKAHRKFETLTGDVEQCITAALSATGDIPGGQQLKRSLLTGLASGRCRIFWQVAVKC
jgi:hypothetical protein